MASEEHKREVSRVLASERVAISFFRISVRLTVEELDVKKAGALMTAERARQRKHDVMVTATNGVHR